MLQFQFEYVATPLPLWHGPLCSLVMMTSAELTNNDRRSINNQLTDAGKSFVPSKSYVQGLLQPRLCAADMSFCSAWLQHLALHGCLRLLSMGTCKSSCTYALPSP